MLMIKYCSYKGDAKMYTVPISNYPKNKEWNNKVEHASPT